jgi:hypothetical protein
VSYKRNTFSSALKRCPTRLSMVARLAAQPGRISPCTRGQTPRLPIRQATFRSHPNAKQWELTVNNENSKVAF